MGFRVAPQQDTAVQKSEPPMEPSFNVDLSSKDIASTFDPRCEVGPSGKVPDLTMQDIRGLTSGKASDILGPTARPEDKSLPQTTIFDGETVIAEGLPRPKPEGADTPKVVADPQKTDVADLPKVVAPDSAKLDVANPIIKADASADVVGLDVVPLSPKVVQLNQSTLDAGKVYKREGYYQVAERLLGPGFDQKARNVLTHALRDAWKSQSGKESAKTLSRGDELLTQKNMETVLSSIKNEGLRSRIRERLMSGEAKPPESPSDKHRDQSPRKRRGADDSPQDSEKRDGLPKERKDKREQIPAEDADKTRRDRFTPKTRGLIPTERDTKPPQIKPIDDNGTPKEDRFRDPSAQYEFDKTDTPKGQIKSAYETKYEVGDQFEALTSVYKHGRQTASGIPFNRNEMTVASKEFPFGSVLKITNPSTGLTARVVVTDHGPFAGGMVNRPDGTKTHARVLDLSVGAANAIGMGFTVKNLKVEVESIPEEGKWGRDRRNIHGDYKRSVIAKINDLSRRRS